MKKFKGIKTFNKLTLLLIVPLLWGSCKVEEVKNVTETVKDISGTWQVVDITQNGVDITGTNGLDFSQFRITFKNNTYTLVNSLPFIVYQNGTYKLDDPKVPTQITFTATGGQPVVSIFNYPIVAGARHIVIQFTANPGCNDNTYTYTLQKADN